MSSTNSAVTDHVLTDGVVPRHIDHRDAGTVDTGNRPSRELGHVAEEFDHAAGPGHQSGHAS